MSDIGILAAVEEEIITAISTPAIVVGMPVLASMSPQDLIDRDSLKSPAVGVIYLGTTKTIQYAVGSRRLRATTKWRIAVSSTNLKGTASARKDVYSILEGIRNQLHYLHSAQSPRACYLFLEEQCPDTQSQGKIVAYADFTLDLILGN